MQKQQHFSKIINIEFDKKGSVEEFLSKQFTVLYEDGSYGFLMYTDRDVTWKPLDEIPKKDRVKGSPHYWTKISNTAMFDVNFDTANDILADTLEQPTTLEIPEEEF